MYLLFSNSLLLLLLPFRLAVWHSLASIKLVAESSPPLCGSLLLLSSLRMALTDNTMTHTTLTQTLAADVPFPTCTREKSMRSCRQSWERETERDRVELRYMHFDKNKELIAQHNTLSRRLLSCLHETKWELKYEHTHTPIALLLSRVVLSLTALPSRLHLLLVVKSTRAHSHTSTGALSLSASLWPAVYKMMRVGGGEGKRTFGVLIIKFVVFFTLTAPQRRTKIVVEYLYAYYYCCLFRLLRTMGVVIVVVVAPVFALLFLFCCRVLCFHTQHSFGSLFCLLLR